MSDDRLEREMERLAEGGGPPAGWQDKVLTAIARPAPPAPHTPWPIALAGSGLVVAAAIALVVIGLRGPEARRSTGPAAIEPRPAGAERMDGAGQRLDEAVEHLLQARTEADRAEAEQLLREARKELEAVKSKLEKARVKWPKLDDGKVTVKCDPNDPLCGLE